MLKLRRIDEGLLRLTLAADAWQARGWSASLEYLPRMGSWIRVQDTAHTWQGWVEPGMWLEGAAHELASLACCADSEQLAARLFTVTATPLHLPMPELRYDVLDVGTPIDGAALPEAMLLKVRAAECPVWLTRVPEVRATMPLDVSGVRFSLDVEIGRSPARLATLRSIRRGDVLIVRDVKRRLSCAGSVIGGYQQEEGSGMLETYLHDEIEDMMPERAREGDDFGDMAATSGGATSLAQLPVELVFVLQRERMTLAELEQLGRTRVLALQPGAEQHVEVRANGTLLARGELVQLDGRLGVEIFEWLMETDDAQREAKGLSHVE
ncbi:YscQ/HrcQ family type III secretion apparatus protein [Pandoraea commovens]|uniref:Surface presentation of antigens protein SpaO n=1 Tax=Pandoraea commovens TaxID=2508289 RepID=A0A5E4TYN4_9BURK|nr:YscQ/HrcQ family type III secretion apparatus protein [Pandoraea commovens]VVD93086.1 Surface presentation of antigens protein SpaO [Pandoraea commovens]